MPHTGMDGPMVLLKDIVTQQVLRCHSATGYSGESGQLWYARLLPPPVPDIPPCGHHHTLCAAGRDGAAVPGLHRPRSRPYGRSRQPAARGCRVPAEARSFGQHWNEYIFLAYVNHQSDAIFLAGIPDIRESLPQA
jgi:hypothetical protein